MEPPPLPGRESLSRFRGCIIANVIVSLVLFAFLFFVVPVFAAMFADFGAPLPWPTLATIDVTSYVKFHPWWMFMELAAWGVAVDNLHHRCPAVIPGLLRGLLVFHTSLLVFAIVSLWLPVFELGAVARAP